MTIAAKRFARNNTIRERLDPKLYSPTKLDTDQWLEAAKGAGAMYAVFTATHFNGFMHTTFNGSPSSGRKCGGVLGSPSLRPPERGGRSNWSFPGRNASTI